MDKAFVIVNTARYRLVTVQGDVDGASAGDFRIACTSSRPVIVDLLRCPYIDSSGLNALIARNRSGDIALVLKPDCRIYRIFEITQLLEHFRIVATPSEAISLILALPERKPTIEDPDY